MVTLCFGNFTCNLQAMLLLLPHLFFPTALWEGRTNTTPVWLIRQVRPVSLKPTVYCHYMVYTAICDGIPSFMGITRFMSPPPEQEVSVAGSLWKWLRCWHRQAWWERRFVDCWDSPGNAHSPYLTIAPIEVGTPENHLGVDGANSLLCTIPQGPHWRIFFPQSS